MQIKQEIKDSKGHIIATKLVEASDVPADTHADKAEKIEKVEEVVIKTE